MLLSDQLNKVSWKNIHVNFIDKTQRPLQIDHVTDKVNSKFNTFRVLNCHVTRLQNIEDKIKFKVKKMQTEKDRGKWLEQEP